ncbi:hypothetical protein [Paraburkholderia hospita]|uniref:hypothetical protein n=1 Tax=Paraburkholderia hospita TaxID=169430 RepID=UPI0010564905|nr:hypothetical protein [Paraburkholderia hospita]
MEMLVLSDEFAPMVQEIDAAAARAARARGRKRVTKSDLKSRDAALQRTHGGPLMHARHGRSVLHRTGTGCNRNRAERAISFAELARLDYIGNAAAHRRWRSATRRD